MSHRDFGGSCHGRHSQSFVFLSLSIPLSWGFVFTLLLSASLHPLLFFLSLEQEHFGKDKSAEFQLFYSPHGKDLLFTDATIAFLRVPPKMDAKLYLGYEYFSVIQHLGRGV